MSEQKDTISTERIAKMEDWEREHIKQLVREYGFENVTKMYGLGTTVGVYVHEMLEKGYSASEIKKEIESQFPVTIDIREETQRQQPQQQIIRPSFYETLKPSFYETLSLRKSEGVCPLNYTVTATTLKPTGEELAYAIRKPIPETFQFAVAPKEVTQEEAKRMEEMKKYTEKLKEESPIFKLGSQLTDWSREKIEKMWSSPADFLVGLGAWFTYVIGESLKGIAAAELVKMGVAYQTAKERGIEINVPSTAKDIEKASFLTQYYNINVGTELILGYATGKAIGLAAKGVAKAIPQTIKERVSDVFERAGNVVKGETKGVILHEQYLADEQRGLTIATIEGRRSKIIYEGETKRLEIPEIGVETVYGDVRLVPKAELPRGATTSGLAKINEEIAAQLRFESKILVGKAKPGEEIESVTWKLYSTKRGFFEFQQLPNKKVVYESGVRPALVSGIEAKTVSGKPVRVFVKEFSPTSVTEVYYGRIFGRQWFTKFDIVIAPFKEEKREALVIFEKRKLIFPFAKEKTTTVKIWTDIANYMRIDKGKYKAVTYPKELEELLYSLYPKKKLPVIEKGVPSSIRFEVFRKLNQPKTMFEGLRGLPKGSLSVIAEEVKIKPLIKITQQTLVETIPKIRFAFVAPVPKLRLALQQKTESIQPIKTENVFPYFSRESRERSEMKEFEKEILISITKLTPNVVFKTKEPIELPPPPPPPPEPVPPPPIPFFNASAILGKPKIPPFMPFGGGMKRMKQIMIAEFYVDEKKIIKELLDIGYAKRKRKR